MRDYDVVVLGAGAAGLVAAARAGRVRRPRLARREKPPAGREDPDVRRHSVQYHQCPRPAPARRRFRADRPGVRSSRVARHPGHPAGVRRRTARSSRPALRRFDVDATVDMFEEAGVATKVEGNGKIFPVSDRADARAGCARAAARALGRGAPLPEPGPGDRRGSHGDWRTGFAVRAAGRDDHGAPGDRRGRGLLVPGLRHDRRRLFDRAAVRPHDRRSQAGPRAAPGRREWVPGLRGPEPVPTRSPRSIAATDGAPAAARGGALRPLRD